MICNRQMEECIICYDLSFFTKTLCSNCDCYICKICAKKYIIKFKNKKCPKCRSNLSEEIISSYKSNNVYNCFKLYFIFFLILSLSYFIGYGITKSHRSKDILINFFIGFVIFYFVSFTLHRILVSYSN